MDQNEPSAAESASAYQAKVEATLHAWNEVSRENGLAIGKLARAAGAAGADNFLGKALAGSVRPAPLHVHVPVNPVHETNRLLKAQNDIQSEEIRALRSLMEERFAKVEADRRRRRWREAVLFWLTVISCAAAVVAIFVG